MKRQILDTHNIILISLAITVISSYQLYWLVNYYNELKIQLNDDVEEVLRSSDFEELAHRVEEISKMNIRGRVDVNIGYDHDKKKSVTRSSVTGEDELVKDNESEVGTHTVVSPKNFGNILKRPEDLIVVGLNMQRGIHSSLDMIMEVNLDYLDSIITKKLDSIGVSSEHQLLYVRNKKMAPNISSSVWDTLAIKGSAKEDMTDYSNYFSLKVSDEAEYQMTIPEFHLAIIKKMLPIILFSLSTLVLLVTTFLYLIRTMKKQMELEEIKTDFTNNITHELKTPIAVAFAANDALLNFDSGHNTPRMNRYLEVCKEQLSLLDRLVEQILSLSVERDKPLLLNIESVNLKNLISSLVNSFKLKYADKVSIKIDIKDDIYLSTDRMHLSNIVSNLIDNAIKYSKESAEITIFACEDSPENITLEIRDNGVGITKEQQKYIFDKFYRVPHGNVHDVKGYGLGLYYVKSMIEKLGGSVSVKSTYGKGSVFKLTLRKHYEEYCKDIIS